MADFRLPFMVAREGRTLACDWIERRLSEDSMDIYMLDRAFEGAITALTKEDKLRLMRGMPNSYRSKDIIEKTVGDELELYRTLLHNVKLESYHHLVPLSKGPSSGTWGQMAKTALLHGYGHSDIAMASFPTLLTWVGEESEVWKMLAETFDQMCTHSDKDIRRIAEIAKSRAESSARAALEDERTEAVYGRLS